MTTQEFSDEFDVLLNSASNIPKYGFVEDGSSIILDEYEKSVFLTIAQESIVLEYYNGTNSYGNYFEETEDVKKYLKTLVTTYSTTDFIPIDDKNISVSKEAVFVKLPESLWFTTYESVTLEDSKLPCNNIEALVVPITQDTYYKINRNPFRGSSTNRVLRLDINNGVELISKYKIKRYLVRYITKPKPIILTALPSPLTINGVSDISESELHQALHRPILERAVSMAIQKRANK